MSDKSVIWISASIGSVVGSLIPGLWHAGLLSLWGILFSGIGGVIGILAASRYIRL